jgi:hypothetical protein
MNRTALRKETGVRIPFSVVSLASALGLALAAYTGHARSTVMTRVLKSVAISANPVAAPDSAATTLVQGNVVS